MMNLAVQRFDGPEQGKAAPVSSLREKSYRLWAWCKCRKRCLFQL